ncbi:SAM-dependent methyltransferase [Winogradskya humida]|uniref:Methyltransferase type 11 n=1 Tax=Winogradskya humida TaxID=113566 RepID=A0ABQ4A2K4_9ACTN|nr:class I SAM-dependent methyltransferase [Actinoplanes humidus]GIE24577.1 methyltransferase type 11 [Actinoplanes humidus]
MSTTETPRSEYVGKVFNWMAELIEIQGGSMHVGYWTGPDDHSPMLEAINRCTDLVVSQLRLGPRDRLLDIGCGVGVPAIRAAHMYDADVVGIANSEWQVEEAQLRVKQHGVRAHVTIEFGDANALKYPDASFDAVLAFQSLQHAEDRSRWLDEMFRVLRPGGQVVIVDFYARTPLTDEDRQILLAQGMEPPLPSDELRATIAASGFVIGDVIDGSENVRRSYPAYFDRLDRIRDDLSATLGDKVAMQEQAMRRMLPIYQHKIGFQIISADKPE